MIRPAFFILGAVLAGAPAAASTYYAKLASPTTARIIAHDISWSCGEAGCQGATDESRPAVLCQSLAKRAGQIDSFTVDGRAFTAAELQECNALARSRPGKAISAQ